MKKPLFVTGIGTGVGKTLLSAIIVEKLKADYWKPIQSGDLDQSDTITLQSLTSNPTTVFHPETYRLSQPYSPHKSARIDQITIKLDSFTVPETNNHLVIEGAGGLMVPLNETTLIIDLIKKLDAEVILVSRNYLGSINHTLLSAELLKNRSISIKGIIFNGNEDKDTEEYILNYTQLNCIGRIPEIEALNKNIIREMGALISLPEHE